MRATKQLSGFKYSLINAGQRAFVSTPYRSDRTSFLARWFGSLLVFAGLVGGIALMFPNAEYANMAGLIACSAIVFVTGVLFLSGAMRWLPFAAYRYFFAASTLVAAEGAYAGGTPLSGAQFFYLWIVPYIFAFSTPFEAFGQVTLMGASYAVVLAVQVHLHPGFAPSGLIIGMWFIVVATEVILGLFIRRLSRSLRESDQRFEQAFERSPIGAAFIGADSNWIEVNESLCLMLGYARDDLVGHSILDTCDPADHELVQQMLANRGDQIVEFEIRFHRPDQSLVWVTISIALVTPEVGPAYLFSQFRDITEHKLDREILAHQAIHDPLTGLFNRTLLLDRLVTALRRPDATGKVAVILLDLDQFKVVNDSLGHHVGDQLLASLAPVLAAATEESDTLARFGGDEFVILCDNLRRPIEAISRANRLASALRQPITIDGSDHVINASVGVAIASDPNDTAASLLRDADAAMYRAKATGRNRIEMFDRSMREQALSRLEFEHDLRDALQSGQLQVVYQPVVDINSGRPVMFEALVRWNHPTRGYLLPDEFIPLAEEIGFINDIGNYVLQEALQQLSSWQSTIPATTANRPQRERFGAPIRRPPVRATSCRISPRATVQAGSFAIELTESVLLESRTAEDSLGALRDLGVVILLDDFGTGYSSLAYLERLPIDILKIDKSFIARIDDSPESTVVLEAILSIAKALRIRTIAEGIESENRLDRLRELGCTLVQGNAISPPLQKNEVTLFLEERGAIERAIGQFKKDQ